MDPDIRALAQSRIEQAEESLLVGQFAIDKGFNRDAMNRCYYTMFYSVLALLALKQMETSKHKGAISLFDKEYVRTGLFSKEYSVYLHDAFEQRLQTDYEDFAGINTREVKRYFEKARAFLDAVKGYLEKETAE